MLVDAPFAPILREWQWSSRSGTTALFWLLGIVAVALLALRRCRSRLTFFELAVLVVTFVGAVQAVRGVIWFALAAAADPPGGRRRASHQGGHLGAEGESRHLAGRACRPRRRSRRVPRATRVVVRLGVVGVARYRPSAAATRDPNVKLWATDGTADWLLWRIPDLRGRLAYDVRFELYDEQALARIVDYGFLEPGWRDLVRGYDVVVVDDPEHLRALRGEPRTSVVFRDRTIFVLSRSN